MSFCILDLRRLAVLAAPMMLVALAACTSKPTRTVSVEDRTVRPAPAATRPATASPAASTTPVGAGVAVASAVEPSSNAGRPGFYTVRPGDTLVRIGLDHGQNWRDIARWNQIENPNLIEVGQVLRVRPEAAVARTPARSPAAASPTTASPTTAAPTTAAPTTAAPTAAAPSTAHTAASPRDSVRSSAPETTRESPVADGRESRDAPREAAGEVAWAWPASGPVLQGFDEQRNKGLDIGGKAGDPVLAAADGQVVYAGSALRGYGNLVIIKHNATYLSAYAHNQTLLVKESQAVRRGQKIAEMGNSDAERVQLHFEIRRDGKPTDPARLLPGR